MCQWRANAMQGVVRRGRGGVEISGRDGGLVGWGGCGSRRVDGPCPAPGTHGRMLLPATRAGHACEGGLRSLLRGWACDRARTTTSPYHGHNTILSNPLPQRGYMVSIRFLLTGLDYVLAAAFVSPTFWIAKRRFWCMKVALILISD